ncbi:MAG: hypothetical protein R6V53_05395 [Candidatus Woesearchaeota archaeon]
MDEKYRFWKKYIDRNLYRVVSSEYLPQIKKEGLNPKENPFQQIIPEIKKLFRLVLKLEKKGFIHEQDWGFKKVTGEYIVMVSLEDIDYPFIDFTPDYNETYFYKRHKGGALVQTIKKITEDIITRRPKLTSKELELVHSLNNWSEKKSQFNNKTLFVKGSSRYFESALFQIRLGKRGKDKYWKSPFGRFENFQTKNIGRYEPYLKGEKPFYLRLTEKMPAKEIYKII